MKCWKNITAAARNSLFLEIFRRRLEFFLKLLIELTLE